MNKFKKAVEDLQNYLGRDSTGLGLLKKVASTGNEIRTQFASTKNELESLRDKTDSMLKELTALRLELDESKQTIRQCQDIIKQQQYTLSTVTKNKSETEDSEPFTSGDLLSNRAVRKLLVRLKKECPKPPKHFIPGPEYKPDFVCLNEIISSYSGGQLLKLGMIVASYAIMFRSGIAVYANPNFVDVSDVETSGRELDDSPKGLFVRWLKSKIDYSLDEQLDAILVGSKAVPPSERWEIKSCDTCTDKPVKELLRDKPCT